MIIVRDLDAVSAAEWERIYFDLADEYALTTGVDPVEAKAMLENSALVMSQCSFTCRITLVPRTIS